MADTAQRPSTADGTTDWEAVFEDAQTGFIPLIAQAHTPEALKECAALVIRKLFSRKSDLHEVEHFTAELAGIIRDGASDADLETMRADITGLLREIKDERIRLAHEHVARKRKGAGEGEERRGAKPGRRRRRGKAKPRSASAAQVVTTAAAMVALAVVGVLIAISLSGAPEELAPASELIAQINRAAGSGTPPRRHVYGGRLTRHMVGGKLAITVTDVPQKPCVNTAWSLAPHGQVVINGVMPQRITHTILVELCARLRTVESGGGESPSGDRSPTGHGATLSWFPEGK